ncbi:hypothetical protein EOL70_10425 [Leucothrix sargassi]|nr:hypothetical protein EOL70_10425 [Leucothrix sargassi]
MAFYIDAWLDRPHPYVQVKNKQSSEVVADFSSDELAEAVQNGDICFADFFDTSAKAQSELVKSLLLLRCCVDMSKDFCKELFTPPSSYH